MKRYLFWRVPLSYGTIYKSFKVSHEHHESKNRQSTRAENGAKAVKKERRAEKSYFVVNNNALLHAMHIRYLEKKSRCFVGPLKYPSFLLHEYMLSSLCCKELGKSLLLSQRKRQVGKGRGWERKRRLLFFSGEI